MDGPYAPLVLYKKEDFEKKKIRPYARNSSFSQELTV